MKHLSTLLSLGIAASALAQPTLTFNGNAPQPGTSYEWHFGPYMAPGAAGAEQVWDMSGATTDSTTQVMLVDPSTTTFGASFPTATVAEVSDGSTVYYRTAADGVYMVGHEAEGFPVVFSEEGRFMSFPCNHQTAWTDTYSATFTSEGTTVQQDGDVSGEADGYGTLILPGGSTHQVLRVHWIQEVTIGTSMFSTTTVFDSYLYYVPGRSYPLVQTTTSTTSFLGNTITQQFTQWTDDIATGLPDGTMGSASMDLFPVPTSGDLYFDLPAHFSGMPLVRITDAAGRTVRGARDLTVRGTRGGIDVSALPAGIYQLTAIDKAGQQATARFIVQ